MNSKLIEGCVTKTSSVLGIPEEEISKILLKKYCKEVFMVSLMLPNGGSAGMFLGKDIQEISDWIILQITPTKSEFDSIPTKETSMSEGFWEDPFYRIPKGKSTYSGYCKEIKKYVEFNLSDNTNLLKEKDFEKFELPKMPEGSGEVMNRFLYLTYFVTITKVGLSQSIKKITDNSSLSGIRPKYILVESHENFNDRTEAIGLFQDEKSLLDFVVELIPSYKKIKTIRGLEDAFDENFDLYGLSISEYIGFKGYYVGDANRSEGSIEFVMKNPTIKSSFLIRNGYLELIKKFISQRI